MFTMRVIGKTADDKEIASVVEAYNTYHAIELFMKKLKDIGGEYSIVEIKVEANTKYI